MKIKFILCLVLTIQLLGSCASLYDHYTFTETVEAKVQATSLIELSENPYSEYIIQVEAFKNQLEKMLIYERAKSKNTVTIRMWEFANNPDNSIHKFLKLWEEKETLSPEFTKEFSVQIEKIFDLMIDYETKKDKSSENALIQIMQTI